MTNPMSGRPRCNLSCFKHVIAWSETEGSICPFCLLDRVQESLEKNEGRCSVECEANWERDLTYILTDTRWEKT